MSSKFEITGEIIRPLDERIKRCRQADNKTIQDLSDMLEQMGIKASRPVVSKVLAGKQEGNTELIKALEEYADKVEGEHPNLYKSDVTTFMSKSFTETKDARNVIGVCSAAQETGGLGVIVGKSGVGKTHALKYYSSMPRVAYVECDSAMGVRDFISAVEEALGVTGTATPNIWPRLKNMQRYFAVNKGYLLIVDEADKLISINADRKIETLRSLFDQSTMGIVISGELALKTTIENYSDRFANRVDFFTKLQGLSEKEVKEILSEFNITDEAMEVLCDRATNKKNGCYRLFDRTMDNIARLMKHKDEDVISLDIIQEASSLMML